MLAGVLLVVLCALGGVLLFASADDRTEVLVAAGDLEPGEPISRGDLRIERLVIDGDVGSLSPAAADALVGLLPVGRIPAGTLLAQGMFADEVPLAPNEVVFGAALDPGEAPLSGVQVGAPVELLDVPKASPSPGPVLPHPRAAGRPRSGRGRCGPSSRWPPDSSGSRCACLERSPSPHPRRRSSTRCASF